ncbi:MAG: DUF1616 domain-containing protein [Candidatus Saliniplasma sp.]
MIITEKMILRIIVATLFIFFLPGFMLVNALFPRKGELDKEFDMLYRITLGMGMSIVITILNGFFLGSIPVEPDQMGYFVAENIWLMLISITIFFFWVGWYRGAYQWMGWLHPKLERPEPPEPGPEDIEFEDERDLLHEMQKLARRRQQLKYQIKEAKKKSKAQAKSIRNHYQKKKERAQKELKEVDERLKELEKMRAEELY